MDINKFCKNNSVLYKDTLVTVMDQLNYNQYLIKFEDDLIIVNIFDLKPIQLDESIMKELGFSIRGESVCLDSKESSVIWSKDILIGDEISSVAISLEDNDSEDLSLEHLVGIKNVVPEKYKYLHQIQNILSYITNENIIK